MKTILIKLDPPDVDIEDVEDFLATDDLFVEYFNIFLKLPTFAEPLCFNKETGGFEVVSEAKKELAKKIKDALRNQKRTPRMYRVAKHHSYIDIPLIPIINNTGDQENQEINTAFTVTTLNKEQGIHWIKAERLPNFLDSDLYLEYRLAKLLSQARITGEQGDYVLMKIDFKPRIKKVKKKAEEEQVQIDPKEQLMKDMYVSMGNASTTETDTWFNTAHIATCTETTYTSLSRQHSETIRPQPSIRPTSARPISAYSDAYNRSDSGMGGSVKSSAKNSSYGTLYQSRFNMNETEDEILMSKLFSSDGQHPTHRSDSVCVISKDVDSKSFASPVYAVPNIETEESPEDQDSSNTSRSGDLDDEKDSGKGDEENIELNESMETDSGKPVVFKTLDELGNVIVGVVLKTALSKLMNVSEGELDNVEEIQNLLTEEGHSLMTLESLDKAVVVEELQEADGTDGGEGKDEPVNEPQIREELKKNLEEESDVDSLLDSEEDYEEEDTFFRKHKNKVFKLCNRKGLDQFKKFLKNTLGEKNFNLWIDIDRMRLMTDELEIQLYLNILREKYHNTGAPFELTVEQKCQLGLSEPTAWTRDKLLSVHNQIADPLVLYWAPRFLLKQLMRTNPNKNTIYQHQKLLKPAGSVNPKPPTATLLPLRPKTCVPRLRSEVTIVPQEEVLADQISMMTEELTGPDTSPPVGLKRVYAEETVQFINKWQKDQSIHTQVQLLSSPRPNLDRTSTPQLRRPMSAVYSSRTGLKVPERPKSAVKVSTRPSTARSSSSRISVESATGHLRIKSARPKSAKVQLPQDVGSKPRSRPSSAASSIVSIRSEAASDTSEFLGGQRMENLLQSLHQENNSGGFFKRYIERCGVKEWSYNLNFWRDVQAYHLLFYAKTLDPFTVRKKARYIYSQYIVVGAPHNVGCAAAVAKEIRNHIDPPFEELFDEVEEHAITVLFHAWQQMSDMDKKTYSKVELIEVKRHLETKSKYVLNLQKSGLIKQRVTSPDVMEGYEDPVYDEALIENIPEEFKDYTLEKLVHNRIELEHFRNFLSENYASMDIMCWMDVEAFRRIPHTDEKKRDAKAREIKSKYLNKKYFFGANSPAGKEGQDKVAEAGGGWGKLLEDRPPNPMILEAQKYVRDRLEKKWLPLFLVTPDFAVRQKPRTSMDDVVDDVMVQKKKKSLNMLKLLDSKWVSSSKEIIIFRKALLNPVTSVQFRRFASIKGDSLENDVLFWLEVQTFKNLYHAHCDDALINQKINTIINCFIDSQIPPTLQIDIPQDMADKILDRKYEKSPYLFREAQLVVFRVLFPHWNEFCEFRMNLADEKVMPLIERRRRHAKIREKKKQQELDDRQAREAERRAAAGLPPLGDDDDVFQDPFKALGGGAESEAGEVDTDDKDKISWSYSTYMNALEREELLNNTDESSFTSLLTDTASVKSEGSILSASPSDGDKKGSKVDVDSQTDRKKSLKTDSQLTLLGSKRRTSRASSIEVPAKGNSRTSILSKGDNSPPTEQKPPQAKVSIKGDK